MSQNNRGKITKPIAPEIVKYINGPTLTSDFSVSYETMLDVNRAHVLMLLEEGIVQKEVVKKILVATDEISKNKVFPEFGNNPKIEDLYTYLEQVLIGMVGLEIGGQQHTARSRNDLGATVLRMDVRNKYLEVSSLFINTRKILLSLAKNQGLDAVMSGYTHMQPSEPITFAHWASAVLTGLERDYRRLSNAWAGLNICPLGSCSMGSTSFKINRNTTSQLLGFDSPMRNSLDGVATRDYALEITSALTIAADTLSRMAFDLYIWSTPEYGYVEVDDSCAVCSSIMPQKKNPFTLEHIKAKAGHMQGYLMAMLSTMKNIIYSHSKDTSVEATKNLLTALNEMESDFVLANVTLGSLTLHTDKMLERAKSNFCTVTELANYLVRYDGLPFREAHNIVAGVVAKLCEKGENSSNINAEIVRQIAKDLFNFDSNITDEIVNEALDPGRIAEAKDILGGTSQKEVKRQLEEIEKTIKMDENILNQRKEGLLAAKNELSKKVNSTLDVA